MDREIVVGRLTSYILNILQVKSRLQRDSSEIPFDSYHSEMAVSSYNGPVLVQRERDIRLGNNFALGYR